MDHDFVGKLRRWFLSQARDLPWRVQPSPYAVWVSEVMLQQTQVAVVIPYFERWMERFPTVSDLAEAPLEDVLKLWEGLGYYSRARNLHKGARDVVEKYGGSLPSTAETLGKIKGIGPYTVGAILSFAFRQRAAAVDGNVLRVLSRYYCIPDDIGKSKSVRTFVEAAERLLPEKEPWVIAEALIELGATVCARVPRCHDCPVRGGCLAYRNGTTGQFPVKAAKSASKELFRAVAVVCCRGHFLVGCGEKGKVMADLYEFPYFELGSPSSTVEEQLENISSGLGDVGAWREAMPVVKHTFTRFRASLYPHLFVMKDFRQIPGYRWMCHDEIRKVPFSSGHRRILNEVLSPGS